MHGWITAILRSAALAAAALSLSGCIVLSDSLRHNEIRSVWSKPLPPQQVFFVTDRAPEGTGFSLHWDGGAAHCGRATVPIANALSEHPAPDPALEAIACDADDDMAAFARQVADAAKPCGRVLIEVHGYNLSFRTALLHGAQAAMDTQWRCATILFNWSSEALFNRYAADIERSGYAVPLMLQLLRALQAVGLKPDILAHSMGGRITLGALGALCQAPRPVVGELILAAPDVSAAPGDDDFAQLLKRDAACVRRTTLYASDNDLALIASQSAHGGVPRAGGHPLRAMDYVSARPRIEVVDATLTTGDISGHAYYVFSYEALADLMWVLDGASQEKRVGLGTLTCTAWPGDACPASGRYALKVVAERQPGLGQKILRNVMPLVLPLQPN